MSNIGPILVIADQPVIAALVGMLVELTGRQPVFARANEAVRLLEVRFNLELSQKGTACNDRQSAQVGQGPAGDNFNPCAILSPNGSSLAGAFGAAGAGGTGTLVSTGAQ